MTHLVDLAGLFLAGVSVGMGFMALMAVNTEHRRWLRRQRYIDEMYANVPAFVEAQYREAAEKRARTLTDTQ